MGKKLEIIVSVPNWEKYNPRQDRTNFSWFRFENRFFHDQNVFKLSTNSKLLAVFVFCEISSNAGKETALNLDYISALLNVRKTQVVKHLRELKENGIIEFDDSVLPSSRRHDAVIAPQMVVLRDSTNVRDKTDERTVAARAKAPPTQANEQTPVGEIRDAFKFAYTKHFGHDYPGWGAKENKLAQGWLKSVSKDKALELCRIYPTWADPFISKLGHPFALLTSQYVQLEAWARAPEKRVQMIAQGRAIENVNIKRATEREESKRGLQYRLEQAAEDLRDTREGERTVSHVTAKEVPRIGSDAPFPEVPNARGKANATAGG